MRQPAATDQDQCTVTICRGCCCGDPGRYPTIDHFALLADLRRQIDGKANMRVTDCLLKCEDANVVVVSPSPRQRAAGTAPVWLARVFSNEDNTEIAQWLRAGGPGKSPVPVAFRERLTAPFRRADQRGGRIDGYPD